MTGKIIQANSASATCPEPLTAKFQNIPFVASSASHNAALSDWLPHIASMPSSESFARHWQALSAAEIAGEIKRGEIRSTVKHELKASKMRISRRVTESTEQEMT